jgi:hypothetical protein
VHLAGRERASQHTTDVIKAAGAIMTLRFVEGYSMTPKECSAGVPTCILARLVRDASLKEHLDKLEAATLELRNLAHEQEGHEVTRGMPLEAMNFLAHKHLLKFNTLAIPLLGQAVKHSSYLKMGAPEALKNYMSCNASFFSELQRRLKVLRSDLPTELEDSRACCEWIEGGPQKIKKKTIVETSQPVESVEQSIREDISCLDVPLDARSSRTERLKSKMREAAEEQSLTLLWWDMAYPKGYLQCGAGDSGSSGGGGQRSFLQCASGSTSSAGSGGGMGGCSGGGGDGYGKDGGGADNGGDGWKRDGKVCLLCKRPQVAFQFDPKTEKFYCQYCLLLNTHQWQPTEAESLAGIGKRAQILLPGMKFCTGDNDRSYDTIIGNLSWTSALVGRQIVKDGPQVMRYRYAIVSIRSMLHYLYDENIS